VEGRLELHVLAAGKERVERRLLERRADGGAYLRSLLDHVVAGHPRLAAGRRKQRGEHVDRGGLARAVRAEEAVDLAGLDAQVDAVHGARALLEFADQPAGLDGGVGHAPHITQGALIRVG
jgi:hypothetical protein